VRARVHKFQDTLRAVKVGADQTLTLDLPLAPFLNAKALSDSLSASAHITQVKFPTPKVRTAFISQFNYCHQIGNELTRTPRRCRLGKPSWTAWKAMAPS
jgi:virginiamycin B lyase